MRSRRGLLAGAVLVILLVLTVVSVITTPPRVARGPSALPPGSGAPSASPSDAGGPPPLTATYRDGPLESTLSHQPTEGEGQAKVWYNDATWWAVLIDPASQELRIARLDWPTQHWFDTGILVDERLHVRADVLWDGTTLTILTAGSKATSGEAARIIRFHYDKPHRAYLVDPDFPISLSATGVVDPAIARDSKGVLWLTYIEKGVLIVRHTLTDDVHWTPQAGFAVDGADGVTRTVGLDADGRRIAVAWNRTNEPTLHVALHQDGAADGAWTTTTTAVDGLQNALGGLSVRGDVAASGERLLIAFETAADAAVAANPLAPGAVVMVLESDGTWANIQLGRVKDHLAAPILAIDHARGVVYAIADATSIGQVTVKQSPLDHLAFEAGPGDPLISSASDPALRNPYDIHWGWAAVDPVVQTCPSIWVFRS